MKLGCSSWSYHASFRAGRIDQQSWLRVCAEEMAVDGVEFVDLHFPTTDPLYLRELKKRCADLHLTIAGLAVTNDFGGDDRRAFEADKVRQWCDVAAYLGAPVVRVFAGWVPSARVDPNPGRVIGMLRKVLGTPKADHRRLWSDVTAALRQCADHAAERGIVLALQNNRSDGIVGTTHELRQCVHDVGSPWLRICLDPADLADRTYADTLLSSVVQVHTRFRDVTEDGSDRQIRWPELVQFLHQGRYRGFALVDYEGVEDPETAVPRAVRYMRGVMHLMQRQQLLSEPAPERASRDGALTSAGGNDAGDQVVSSPGNPRTGEPSSTVR